MIQQFPPEVLLQVACLLDQNDALHLSYTCRLIHEIVTPRLYFAITVDSSKKIYRAGFGMGPSSTPLPISGNRLSYIQPTNISSLYALNSFFKSLDRTPPLAKNIKVINFTDQIPDISDLQIVQNLTNLLPWCSTLKIFNWHSATFNLPVELVSNIETLTQIGGNYDYSNLALWYETPHLTSMNISSLTEGKHLSNLAISNRTSLKELVVSKSRTNGNDFKFYRPVSDMVPPSVLNITSTVTSNPIGNVPDDFIMSLFSYTYNTSPLQLTKLALKDIVVCPNDALLLSQSLNLSALKSLSILNCTEIMQLGRGRMQPFSVSQSFLQILGPHLTQLTHLNLDLTNALNYNNKTFRFLSGLILESLNINISINSFENLDYNLQQLFASIAPQKLQFLNFDYSLISGMPTTPGSTKYSNHYSMVSGLALSKFSELRYLQLPVAQYRISNMMPILSHLIHLRVLCLNMIKFGGDKAVVAKSPQNTLICQDFFNFYATNNNSGTSIDNSSQYENYVGDFQQLVPSLQCTIFETSADHYAFSKEYGMMNYAEIGGHGVDALVCGFIEKM